MRFTIFCVSLFCVFLTHGFTNKSLAQREIGVHWDIPENREIALSQLDKLQALNISYLELSGRPGEEIWESIDRLGFRVYGQIPITFPLVQTFAEPDSGLLSTISNSVNHYASRPSVKAVGLFKYGAIYKPAFDSTIQPYIRQIREKYPGNLYYTTTSPEIFPADSLFDFKILDIKISANQHFSVPDSVPDKIQGYKYHTGPAMSSFLTSFKKFLQEVSEHPAPVFVESEWLFEMLQENPGFANTIKLYNSNSEFIFPTPREQYPRTFDHSFIVLLLVLIWGMFAVNYHMSPVYRKSLSRYFTGHIFFIEDVMNRHIRAISPVMIILIQNILLAGICFYSLGNIFFSTLGLEAIFYHYPVFSILANPSLSFFLWGCILAIVLTLLGIIWLRISNKEIKSFRQVLNLYAWPLQINFIIATVIVTLLMAGSHPVTILLLALLFAGIYISAFIIAAIDASRYLNRRKILFLTGSIGIYCLVWMGLSMWILTTSMPAVIQLALSVS